MLKSKEYWEKKYENNDTPWTTGIPDPFLVSLITNGTIKPCRALDIGCETGNESIYLAQNGFKVTGIDLSEKAIEEATSRATLLSLNLELSVGDFLELLPGETIYEFAIDRRMFHFLDPEERPLYIEKLDALLTPKAFFLINVSSEFEKSTNRYQFSKDALIEIFSGVFDLVSAQFVTLENHTEKPLSLVCLFQKKN